MKRKIDTLFEQWKTTPNHKPIVVKGCRQCGKTYSVMEFAKTHYSQVVYLNFIQQPAYKSIFASSLMVDDIIEKLTSFLPAGTSLPISDTCIVFDEIQECPRARTALKFFQMDGRFDVMCTGSLLGVSGYHSDEMNENDKFADIPVGYEYIVDMYPLDFEEFLWANNIGDSTIAQLRKNLIDEVPVDDFWHQRLRELLLLYVVIGGMPEAINCYFSTHNLSEVLAIQRGIVDGYRADMIKYSSREDQPRIKACFNSIPAQLSKENKKFTYAQIKTGARAKDYWGSLQWIEDAGIIRRCKNLHFPELPLDGNANNDVFKIYMADIGLLISQLEDGTQAAILQGDLCGYKGAIFENLVADILGKMGRKLYYYHKESGLEIDFVMRYKGQCTLLECKSTTGRAKSLQTILHNENKYHIFQAIKVGDYNIGRNDTLLTLPLYLTFLLTDM